jgi:hypothetical protein
MTSQYKPNESSFVIGPGNENWRTSYLDSLARDLERDLFIAENEDLQFNAVFRSNQSGQEKSGVAIFTLRGPKGPPSEWLSVPVVIATRGRAAGERFLVDRKNEIHSVNAANLQPIHSPETAAAGRTTSVAFDVRAHQLLAWHSRENRDKNSFSGNGRVLIAFDFGKGAWRQIGCPGADLGAVAFDDQKNIAYGLVLPIFSNAVRDLVVMNAHGAVLASVPLSQPFYWDLEAGPPQAVFARGHLIVINSPQSVLLSDGKERLVAQVIAIDPTNGQTFFTGRYFCD